MERGLLDRHLVVDELEGAGGTSINMNVNEVLAARATQMLGAPAVHPNDHVNLSQSTNDVFPTAIRMTCHDLLEEAAGAFLELQQALLAQAGKHRSTVKLGRTCLQDAQPMTFGQTFGAWAEAAGRHGDQLAHRQTAMLGIPLGATAIGTGLGASPGYKALAIEALRSSTGVSWVSVANLFDGLANADEFVRLSGELRNSAKTLGKIGNDLQLMASGPAGGLAELKLPALQAGSSIMPGKVNPVIPISVCQAAFIVSGYDMIIAEAAGNGQLEINSYEPAIAAFLFKAIALLTDTCRRLSRHCVTRLEVDSDRSLHHVLGSSAIATMLVPELGFEAVAELVVRAQERGQAFLDAAQAEGLLQGRDVDELIRKSIALDGSGNG
jgi:aspartate ammonia-lyase